MSKIQIYKVAGHLFGIEMRADCSLWERMHEAYDPFIVSPHQSNETEDATSVCHFILRLTDNNTIESANLIYTNKDSVEPGFVALSVYKDEFNHYFEFTQPSSEKVNANLTISLDYKTATLSLEGTEIQKWLAFNTAVNFCYLLSIATHDTVLAHASCVLYKERAWLFLGKSGTGKSTHSRMWLSALEDVVLMNDDHPVIRISEDGQVIAYGSPWSGKTRCYKNLQAPVGGVIRIVRAPHNKARRLSVIESYASLMTSFSGMTWEKELADGRDRTIQGIIASVPCWAMECLPNEDAALECSRTVTQ